METCDRKRLFQGAGAAERWWVVVDIARKKGINRRRGNRGAILKEGAEGLKRKMGIYKKCTEGNKGDTYTGTAGEEWE